MFTSQVRLGIIAELVLSSWLIAAAPALAQCYSLKVAADLRRFFRGDAAFARLGLYEYLEAEGYGYAIRLAANESLQREIKPFLARPMGRPPRRPIVWHHEFLY